MKITIYELLGMIKDGKAPKIIKYKDFIYEYYEQETVIDYRCYDEKTELYGYLSSCVDYETFNILDNEVEILEEEKKIPEKIDIYEGEEGHYFIDKHCKKIYITCDEVNFMVEEFNQLIDYLKSKGE